MKAMNIVNYLNVGASALSLAEQVFTDAEPLVEKLYDEGKEFANEAADLFDEARAAFNQLKESGVAGTDTGKLAADATDRVTTLFANMKEAAGGDVNKLISIGQAAEAQFKLLIAQLAGGNDVTAQPHK